MKPGLHATAMALIFGVCVALPASAQDAKQDQQATTQNQKQKQKQKDTAQKQQSGTQQSGTQQQGSAQQSAQSGQDMQQQMQNQYQQTAQKQNQRYQQTAQDQGQQAPPVILLSDWNYDTIYGSSWSLDKLMGLEVVGPTGDDIGEVENVIISDQGQVVGIIAEVGGFIDIGDTHVFVPWDQIEFSQGLERVTIPVTQENVEDYVYKDAFLRMAETGHPQPVSSDLVAGWNMWKASDLLEDYAYLNENVGYGWISDLIFTDEGKLHAVVVNADASFGGGYYAYPYYGYAYGWWPGAPYYYLGYGRADVANLTEMFDEDKMNEQLAMKNQDQAKGGAATTGAGSSNRQGDKGSQDQGSK